jgi:hypothetical protein
VALNLARTSDEHRKAIRSACVPPELALATERPVEAFVLALPLHSARRRSVNEPKTTVVAPATYYCGRCHRMAAFVSRTADLATYVCPMQHVTFIDLAKLKPGG